MSPTIQEPKPQMIQNQRILEKTQKHIDTGSQIQCHDTTSFREQ